ncbi:hypothetical protein [Aestuariimicrobium ganziense]|uniref:hypothetical protein n=1 Tax=Aestuariimicrobium ganziense TaxID=2773677 RepID=UPI001944E005|nr:hypothetical protein [Aestuariimicrobium ganziense]
MAVIVLSMVVIVAVALAVAAVVAVGMRGKFVTADPRLRNGLTQVARHLNGDAETPQAFADAVASIGHHRDERITTA